jgi:alpha-L-fucosidase
MNPSVPPPLPAWWTEARFGLFIHWGVYAAPAGVHQGRAIAGASEWLMFSARIPVEEYKKYASDFNPVHYDPEAWVKAAVEAGMGYLVITAKHHDGFALFETAVNDWNVVDATPHGRDLLRPLVEACRRAGLPIGFYYSQAQDWINGGSVFGEQWDPVQKRDFDDYIDRTAIPQIRELLTSYGPGVPAVLWWDTPAYMTPERAARIHAAVEELAPGILQNDRLGGDVPGHFDTPEQRIPARRPDRAWETCMTTNDSWGFNRNDHGWKSSGLLLRQLGEVVSQGGNYLLNLGPRADGTIPGPCLEALHEMGIWMKVNGAAIRGASAGPFPHRLPWGFATRNAGMVYLLVDEWPGDGTLCVPLLDQPVEARLLAAPDVPLKTHSMDGAFLLELPDHAPDPALSVVALRFASEPRLGDIPLPPRPPVIPQPADGALALAADAAEIVGGHLALLTGTDPHLGCWTALDSHPLWRVSLHRGGDYLVEMLYAIPAHRQGTVAHVALGEQALPFAAVNTGGWNEFVRARVGTVTLAPDEELFIRVLPVSIPVGAVMNLRAVYLTPLS